LKRLFIFCAIASSFALLASSISLRAQNSVSPTLPSARDEGLRRNDDVFLPNAPSSSTAGAAQAQPQKDEKSSVGQNEAIISGTVLDTTGATVPGAQISLTHTDGTHRRTLISGVNGAFAFTKLSPGSYLITVEAPGFKPFTSTELVVTTQQILDMLPISLTVETVSTEVTVRPTEVIAAAQVRAEEKQRIRGVIPNFYTSFIYDAAPLTAKQKFSLAARNTFDPFSFAGVSITAGIEQARNSYSGYGQGAAGYGKRWGAKFVDGRSSDFLSHAVFPALFHQDPRYFYQGSGSVKSRLWHAASFAFVLRSDTGRTVPNYSYFLGDMCSGALSNLYYPPASRGANLVFTNAAIGLAGRVGLTVAREFLFKRLTTNVPGNGKP
jgi:hypothetical protein